MEDLYKKSCRSKQRYITRRLEEQKTKRIKIYKGINGGTYALSHPEQGRKRDYF